MWRSGPDEQRRNVYITVGDAELVIEDKAGTALSHWSLPALVRLNPSELPARFAPSDASDEQLEVEEPEMIAALDRVMRAVEKGRRRPGALRRLTLGLTVGFVVGIGALWLPGALRKQAATIIPPAQRMEIGTAILEEVTALTGPACSNPTGTEALAQLRQRLFPTTPVQLVILRDLPRTTLTLPGGIIAMSDSVLNRQDDPDVAAGHILAAALTARAVVPLETFLDRMSFLNLTRMLATGNVPVAAIENHVERLVLSDPQMLSAQTLRPGFDAARLTWGAYARATNLPEGDAAPSMMPPVMEDTLWQALREICTR